MHLVDFLFKETYITLYICVSEYVQFLGVAPGSTTDLQESLKG